MGHRCKIKTVDCNYQNCDVVCIDSGKTETCLIKSELFILESEFSIYASQAIPIKLKNLKEQTWCKSALLPFKNKVMYVSSSLDRICYSLRTNLGELRMEYFSNYLVKNNLC